MTAHDVPAYTELLLPTMVAVFEGGGSGSIDEIVESVIKNEAFGMRSKQYGPPSGG
jgi:hypothetical protein